MGLENRPFITKARRLSNPHFAQGDNRIYLNSADGLISIRWDGTDQKKHVQVDGITVYGSFLMTKIMIADSPTAPKSLLRQAQFYVPLRKSLAQINNDIYVVTVPYVGADGVKINVKDASKAAFLLEN